MFDIEKKKILTREMYIYNFKKCQITLQNITIGSNESPLEKMGAMAIHLFRKMNP